MIICYFRQTVNVDSKSMADLTVSNYSWLYTYHNVVISPDVDRRRMRGHGGGMLSIRLHSPR